MKISKPKRPLARKDGLVIKESSGEVLIYDRDRDKAHCLNQTAALVWKRCDGNTSVSRIAKSLEHDLQTPIDDSLVWYALLQLEKDHLLGEKLSGPPVGTGMNRRDMIRTLGLATAVGLPVVTSIVAPTPAQAATCKDLGVPCTSPAECCSGFCVGGICVP